MEFQQKSCNLFACHKNGYKYIISPLYCTETNDINNDEKWLFPLCCVFVDENQKNKKWMSPCFYHFLDNTHEKFISPLYCFNKKKHQEKENMCSPLFCRFTRTKYIPGTSDDQQKNDYIKKNNLITQEVQYEISPFSFSKREYPQIQKMSDEDIDNELNKELLSKNLYFQSSN
jgi:hypothetical protein